jgi:hypothetical protein
VTRKRQRGRQQGEECGRKNVLHKLRSRVCTQWQQWLFRSVVARDVPPRCVAHWDYTSLQAQQDSHFTNLRGFLLQVAFVKGSLQLTGNCDWKLQGFP